MAQQKGKKNKKSGVAPPCFTEPMKFILERAFRRHQTYWVAVFLFFIFYFFILSLPPLTLSCVLLPPMECGERVRVEGMNRFKWWPRQRKGRSSGLEKGTSPGHECRTPGVTDNQGIVSVQKKINRCRKRREHVKEERRGEGEKKDNIITKNQKNRIRKYCGMPNKPRFSHCSSSVRIISQLSPAGWMEI
ncbi:hypothetical protein B9Z19DRAFT_822229 [Tuber borchii]|uniref:Transmembrane protein n=1 Tax=Tuber borchii TaxID=42251 RepID=A0A2T7A7A3_TUBBO|nr:hypothetical protein B9Z19DRAFT_822229 [Tuber borchii]